MSSGSYGPSEPDVSAEAAEPVRSRSKLLLGYQVISMVTGVGLIILVFIAVPLKYAAGHNGPVAVVGQIHGFLYMVYVLVTLVLAYTRRWNLLKALLVLLAGTVPLAVFFAERKVVRDERAADQEVPAPAA